MDYTTLFTVNALSALDFGSVSIVNLFSRMTNKLNLSSNLDDLTCPENHKQILSVAEACDVFILAIGSVTDTYRKVRPYRDKIFQLLAPFQDKVHVIENEAGQRGLHPLSPSLRNKPWTLVPFALLQPEPPTEPRQSDTDNATSPATRKPRKNAGTTTPPTV